MSPSATASAGVLYSPGFAATGLVLSMAPGVTAPCFGGARTLPPACCSLVVFSLMVAASTVFWRRKWLPAAAAAAAAAVVAAAAAVLLLLLLLLLLPLWLWELLELVPVVPPER